MTVLANNPFLSETDASSCLFEKAEHLLERLFHLGDHIRPESRLIETRLANSQADKISVAQLNACLDIPTFKKHTHAGLILHAALMNQMNNLCAG